MAKHKELLSTRILDHHGKIGPFFFKEFLFVFLACTSLFFLVLGASLFMEIPSSLLLLVPGAFLFVVSLIRFVLIRKAASPWYLHKWVATRWLKPKHIRADTLKKQRSAVRNEPISTSKKDPT